MILVGMIRVECPCGGLSVSGNPARLVQIADAYASPSAAGGGLECAKCGRILQVVHGVLRFADHPKKFAVN